MKTFGYVLSGVAVTVATLLVACLPEADAGDSGDSNLTETAEKQDPLEGAYIKQGGRPVHFVFKRGEADDDDDTFLGDIEDDNGKVSRVSGKIVVSRDNLGTKFTLSPTSGVKTRSGDAGSGSSTTTTTSDAGGDAGKAGDGGKTGDGGATPSLTGDAGASGTPDQPADTRPLAEQAFSGAMHYLKIGKNKTILVRGDATGKTAHYKKFKSWCGEDSDCAKDVQNTGLSCDAPTCNSKNSCTCD